MPFKHLTDKVSYHSLETEISKFWEENGIFERSVSSREGKPTFTFYEGPPTANGRPGIHHVLSRTLKDLVCRYKTMEGFQVPRKAGWDTHGLPVEIEVEKALGFKHKDEIVAYGVENFNEQCKKSVWKYKTEWEEMTRLMGYWVDLDHPYITFHNNYMESIWWALKQYFDRGMIYKGYKIQRYCYRCETPLSTHEVSLGYKDVKDPSIYVKMKLKGEENTYFLVWTTTPWTLVSNVALAVNSGIDYVKVEHKGEKLILAEARLNVLDDDFTILDRVKGTDLLGIQYEPPFVSRLNEDILKRKEVVAYRVYEPADKFLQEHVTKVLKRRDSISKQDIDEEGLAVALFNGERTIMPTSLFARLSTAREIELLQFPKSLPIHNTRGLDEAGLSPSLDRDGEFNPPMAFYVVAADFVTISDGSGIVHIAPAYGEDDFNLGINFCLQMLHPVDRSGNFDESVEQFAHKCVKDADPEIIADLKHRGILYKKETHLHSYPHCWRCSSPLLYYARESWYIRTTDYAQRMIDVNKTIRWIPPEVGSGRFGNWLEENKDWALSRDRFWGTPLPIWICEKCGKQHCVGSVEEFMKGKNVPDPLDLHKPHVDDVTFDCPDCGGLMRRTPELIDVWFDSGSMPFAQWHYPFENKDVFESAYPADFISEGIDQTRGWFYTLHSIGTFLFDKAAYKNVLVNELILDKQGQKMSKSKKNTVDPFELLKKYGADATRWYLVANSPVWRPTLFDEEGIGEVQRKFFSTLVNTYAFFALYANVDGFEYREPRIPIAERAEIDRWILSELNSLVSNYKQWMDDYDVTKTVRAISDFTIDQLSNWYVRRNRRRFWKSEQGKDKIAAYQTLYECLAIISRLIAPFAPFIAEELHRNLNSVTKRDDAESVHLTSLPEPDGSVIDTELEQRMERAIRIVGLVRAMRVKSNLKVRQPLRKIILPVTREEDRLLVQRMADVILEEINVKQIEFVTDDSGLVRKKAKPNFRSLGQKHGKNVQPIAARIREFSAGEITELEKAGTKTLTIAGADVAITKEDVEILHEEIKGWLVESDGTLTVALDTELDEDLIDEGLAREFVNRVQNMRKDAGLEVTDRIRIFHRSGERLSKALAKLTAYIKQETLATDVISPPPPAHSLTEGEINGEQVFLAIEKSIDS